MMHRPNISLSKIIAVCGTLAVPMALPAVGHAKSAMSVVDTDHDGTIDLTEAKAAAGALFDKLEKDHDGTLDIKELKGRVSKKQLAAADPDNDKTLSKDEYLALVESAFKAADPDSDGTIDAKELKTAKGKALARLMK